VTHRGPTKDAWLRAEIDDDAPRHDGHVDFTCLHRSFEPQPLTRDSHGKCGSSDGRQTEWENPRRQRPDGVFWSERQTQARETYGASRHRERSKIRSRDETHITNVWRRCVMRQVRQGSFIVADGSATRSRRYPRALEQLPMIRSGRNAFFACFQSLGFQATRRRRQ
jgi:hypothetical protein